MGEVEHEQMEGALVVEDIESVTERKMLKEKLREFKEKFRNLFKSIQFPVSIFVGREGRLIEYNEAFKKMLGYADEELKDKTFLDFVHPDDYALVLERYRTKYSEDELPLVYEIRGMTKKGEIIPVEISVGTYKKKGRVIGIEVMLRDITERKKMEEELRESEERLRTLYEHIPDPLAVYVGREGRLIEYNKAFRDRWLGYTDEELKDTNFLDLVHPDDRAMLIEEYGKKYSEKDYPLIYEIRGINKKGEIRPFEISVGPYKKRGRVIGIEVMFRDIMERKEMERKLQEYAEHLEEMVEERTKELKERTWALRKSEEMFRNIYNSSMDAIGFVSLDGILLDVNDSFPKLTGYSREELLTGKRYQDMTPKKYHEYEAKIMKRILRTGKPAEYEKEYVRKDGSLVPVLVTAFVVKGDDGKPIGLATIIKDISERKKAKDEIEARNE